VNVGYGWNLVIMDYLENYLTLDKLECDEFLATQSLVTRAMNEFHDLGFVHGDLRPPNILYRDGDVKIIDFDWAGKAEG